MDAKVYRAAVEGSIEKLKAIDRWNNEVTPMGNTVLNIHVARPIGKGKIKIKFIKEVLDLESSLLWHANVNGKIPLNLSSRFGHVKAVWEFIERARGVNEEAVRKMVSTANKRRDTALHEAARGGHDRVVKLLVKADPGFVYEVNEALETPLYLAAEAGSVASVALILDICTSPTDFRGPCARTALHAAVEQGNLEMIQRIIENNEALIRASDDYGFTPLHHAALRNNVQILSFCLDKETTNESAAYIRDKEGRTPLHIAAYFGHLTSFKKIIAERPDCVEIVDNKGQNAIH